MSEVASNGLIEIRVPDIGNYKDVEVIDVAVKAGDSIAVEGTLITLETEKATMDVPSTTAGTIRELKVQRGSKVSQGDVIAIVEAAASAAAPTSPASAGEVADALTAQPSLPRRRERAPKPSPQPSPAKAGEGAKPSPQPSPAKAGEGARAAPNIDQPGFARAHASPSIRKLARELGVDLTRVQGTGEKGRITDVDVKAYVKRVLSSGGAAAPGVTALPRVPVVDYRGVRARRAQGAHADPENSRDRDCMPAG